MIFDLLIIGAGPAGLAAAAAAAESGMQIAIIDDNFNSGGQIWRGGAQNTGDPRAHQLWEDLSSASNSNVVFHFQTKVIHAQQIDGMQDIVIERSGETQRLRAHKMIIATGARELLLPFPGWTLPGVTGAGGLQALTKAGYPVQGKRIVIAGSGPLLMAVAATLVERGAIVSHIFEQTTFSQLCKFAIGLLATPSKIAQAIQLWKKLLNVRYRSDSYVIEALGDGHVQSVRVHSQGKEIILDCDYLAVGYGLLPNIELATALGCNTETVNDKQSVSVNQWQESSITGVYCAGEGTGVGGVDLALAEGKIAGLAASGRYSEAANYQIEKQKWQGFSHRLHQAFSLRADLRHLCKSDTLVCRCEDVSYAQLSQFEDWRSAKLHTRCGMGACQGRVCGAANRFLFSWEKDAGKLPVNSATIASLVMLGSDGAQE
jgi:thioredoxin reductase